jgi:two-component sensor histidine kinase
MSVEAPTLVTGLLELVSQPLQEPQHFELAREWRTALLDPESWRTILETFGSTVKLAVALTDREGHQLGKCHNPQRTWRLAREAKPEAEGECSFCLSPAAPCTAVADAIKTGEVVMVQCYLGLAHVAIPLCLGDQSLGGIVAGQVFTRYPEPLQVQRVAREFGISQQKLWHEAIQEHPVGRETLQVYANLLKTIGHAFLGERYAKILHRELAEANQNIRSALEEKEVLLREIQHRVKNHLQIVASLLNMESNRLRKTKDSYAINVLQSSGQRIAVMAQIQDLLYSNERIGEINLAEYIKDLTTMVIASLESADIRIHTRFDLSPVFVSIQQAVPCGLIVNELITNVFKYAYPNQSGGEVYLGVEPTSDGRVSLTVSDNGIGMPEGLEWQRSDSLGLRIIQILTKQLGGTIELDAQQGVSFLLRFSRC